MDSEPSQPQNLLDSVHIVPFKFKHLPKLIEMLTDNEANLDEANMKNLPKIGYMAFLNKEPIAAGFLRRMEGNLVAVIDDLVSNPYFGSIIRHKGLSLVLNQLLEDAKSLKVKGIIAFSKDKSAILRAQYIGFEVLEHSVLGLRF